MTTKLDYTLQHELLYTKSAATILEFFEKCRPDMHEPDEQRLKAWWKGTVFDNAGTPDEMRVIFKKQGDDATESEMLSLNVCDMLAIIRYLAQDREHWHAQYSILDDKQQQVINWLKHGNQPSWVK